MGSILIRCLKHFNWLLPCEGAHWKDIGVLDPVCMAEPKLTMKETHCGSCCLLFIMFDKAFASNRFTFRLSSIITMTVYCNPCGKLLQVISYYQYKQSSLSIHIVNGLRF